MKAIKWILGILVVLVLLGVFVGMPYARKQTKKHSPERTSVYQEQGLDMAVAYCSPSKKGREIFGVLVPYDKVWRTGANEPTTFATKSDIYFGGEALKEGTYSVWTIPGESSWQVILNDDIPDWGVTLSSGGRETSRTPENDVLTVSVPVEEMDRTEEMFTIDFEDTATGLHLAFSWDRTKISVPINQ